MAIPRADVNAPSQDMGGMEVSYLDRQGQHWKSRFPSFKINLFNVLIGFFIFVHSERYYCQFMPITKLVGLIRALWNLSVYGFNRSISTIQWAKLWFLLTKQWNINGYPTQQLLTFFLFGTPLFSRSKWEGIFVQSNSRSNKLPSRWLSNREPLINPILKYIGLYF